MPDNNASPVQGPKPCPNCGQLPCACNKPVQEDETAE